MARIVKIYAADGAFADGRAGIKVIENYPAFTLAEVDEAALAEIKRSYLVEEITDQYMLPGVPGGIDTSTPRIDAAGKTRSHPAYASAGRLSKSPHHYIVQFIGPIKQEWLQAARKSGADLVDPYDGFSYVARMTPAAVKAVAKLAFVRWIGHLPYEARLSHRAIEGAGRRADEGHPKVPRSRYLPGVYTVQFFRPKQAADAVKAVRQLDFKILESRAKAGFLVVQTQAASPTAVRRQLERLSRVHGVSRISERPVRRKANDHAAALMQAAAALAIPGLGLSGAGEIIAVCDTGLDTGDPATIHPDFVDRIKAIKSYPIAPVYDNLITNRRADDGPADLNSGHGTHTAGSVLGNGTGASNLPGLAGPVRGFSYRATLVFQAIEQEMQWKTALDRERFGRFLLSGIPTDLGSLFADARAAGARIHSNSWGGGNPAEYDEQCRQLDNFVWNNTDFCILFAAGNDGSDVDGDGVIDPGSVTAPGTAKNCITVGASQTSRPQFTQTYGDAWPSSYTADPIKSQVIAGDADDIAAFSSRGPTADGRIKPDVVAPGTYILSTRSRMIAENNFGWAPFTQSKLYMFDSGTSMATPLTAGAVGVLREYLRKQRGIAAPSAALLKASLIAGAVFLRGAASQFDNNQGFGRIDLDAVLAPPPPATVTFVDRPGLQTGELDERVIQVASNGAPLRIVLVYSDFPGHRLVNNLNLVVRAPDGGVSLGNGKQAGADFDADNNVELVHIGAAARGAYRVQVIASNVPSGPQPFALVICGAVAPDA